METNGDYYKGDWVQDQRTGIGMQEYSDGSVYFGQWLKNKWHGQGLYVMADGSRHLGNFNSGEYVGTKALAPVALYDDWT